MWKSRSLLLSAAVAYPALLTPAAASVTSLALSVDASAGLRSATLSLTAALLEQPALLEDLCAIPLRGAEPLHHWEPEELRQLQWPPLEAAAGRDREWIEGLEAPSSVPRPQFVRSLDAVRRHAYSSGASLYLRTASQAQARLAVPRGRPTEFAAACGWRRNDQLLLEEGWADAELASDAVAISDDVLRRAADAVDTAGTADGEARARSAAGWREVRELLHTFGYLSADGAGGLVLSGGMVSDELGRLAQAYCVGGAELDELGAAGVAINIGEAVSLSMEHERRVGLLLSAACSEVLDALPTSLAEDEAALLRLQGTQDIQDIQDMQDEQDEQDGQGVAPPATSAARAAQALHSRLSRKRCLTTSRDACDAWAARPTATASLRRPWKVIIRTSG